MKYFAVKHKKPIVLKKQFVKERKLHLFLHVELRPYLNFCQEQFNNGNEVDTQRTENVSAPLLLMC